ncbi:response regulator [Thalassotalea sp. PLHSN55]|uniref:response regulator n=1 Tax=Thalassotalea sp. PLHSN55 TaxID=3435888 RepID=UPI003F8476AD
MSISKPKVLIIDDDGCYLELLSEALSDNFHVTGATDLVSADKIINNTEIFDIALVDENVGEEKGSEWIKQKVELNIGAESFVLYSGLATDEAILQGLDCGADDFLAKPISLLTLNSKLEKLINYQHTIHHFEKEIKSKDHVINVSMAQASKYGSCMQLSSRLNHCFTLESIREEVFSYLYSMGLKGCLGFYPINEEPSFVSSENGCCSPVEIGVMKLLREKSRLYRFGARTIFNHQLVSLLILNLEDGTTDTDIFIDALAAIIESIGARVGFISYQKSLLDVQKNIESAVVKTKNIVELSKHHQQDVMNEIVQSIGISFHILDLSEEQENYLANLVHNALKNHARDDINFLEVTQLLDQALGNVKNLEQLNASQHEQEINDHEEDEDVLF